VPAPRFQHGFVNDVFISYTHEDDHEEAGLHWVARFEAELRSRLAKVSGQSVCTWRDDRLSGADRFDPEIKDQLLASAVLVPILTPSYFRSEWCTAERATFVERARAHRGLDVGNKARIVKATKTRVAFAQYPSELRELLEFRFYVEEPNGTAREFHLSPDREVRDRFYMVVDDLAQAIEQILRGLETGSVPASKGFIYLGETSSDVDVNRDQLRRSLVHRGYAVLPETPLRLRSGPEAEQIVARDLTQCRLAVYPVGAYYGPVLEGSGDRSITQLQLETAVPNKRNGGLARMVWVPPGLDIEQRQQTFLTRLRTEFPSMGFEIVETPLSEIETHIIDRLEPPAVVFEASDDDADDRGEVYLMCLPADRDIARVVGKCLFAEGYDVRLPPTTDEGYAALHMRRLEMSDAFLVLWGTADEGWLEPVLTELKRAKGLRKGKQILSKTILLLDPATAEKHDFLTHQAKVLPGFSPTPLATALQPFLDELRRANPVIGTS
jgi:hypothetical protein